MPFEKVPYTDNETVIYAKNLNDIQDELIRLNTAKQNKITIDTTPTSGSSNPVSSNGVYNAINTVSEEVSEIEEAIVTDKTLTVSDTAADAQVTGNAISTIDGIIADTIVNYASREPANYSYSTWISSTTNKWMSSSPRRHCGIMSIGYGNSIVHVKANASDYTDVAILTSNSHTEGDTPAYATGWTAPVRLSAGQPIALAVPADGAYLYYSIDYTDVSHVPQIIQVGAYAFQTLAPKIALGLHEAPRSQSALNIVKRCRQMTDIKWTPAVNLKRYMLVDRGDQEIPDSADQENYLGVFKAGVEYTGVPYGRVSATGSSYGYDFFTVGNYIDFSTFVTSVSNPNSRLCKSDVSSLSGHRSLIYASVCSGLVCYALNVPEVPTADLGSISGLNLIGKVNNNGTLLSDKEFQIGDVLLLTSVHAAIITDIVRGSDGTIQMIELSEATTRGLADKDYDGGQLGGLCCRKGFSRDSLYSENRWGSYSLYRYSGEVPYTPNPYVNVGDELDMNKTINYPCMPYGGNNFVFKSGHTPSNIVRVLTSLAEYGYLRVFKNGTEITGSPFTVAEGTEYIDVPEISVGDYTAYLCNIENNEVKNLTTECHWSITA